MTTVAGLLSLPIELHLDIFRYVVYTRRPRSNPWLPILLTNRTMHAEMLTILNELTLYIRIPYSSTQAAMDLLNPIWSDDARAGDSNYYTWREFKRLPAAHTFAQYCKQFRAVILQVGLGNPLVDKPVSACHCDHLRDMSEDWHGNVEETFTALESAFANFLRQDDEEENHGADFARRFPELRVLWYWNCSEPGEPRHIPWSTGQWEHDYPRELEAAVMFEQVVRQELIRRRSGSRLAGLDRCDCDNRDRDHWHANQDIHPTEWRES